jgi:hypothetical protein
MPAASLRAEFLLDLSKRSADLQKFIFQQLVQIGLAVTTLPTHNSNVLFGFGMPSHPGFIPSSESLSDTVSSIFHRYELRVRTWLRKKIILPISNFRAGFLTVQKAPCRRIEIGPL